MRYRVKQITRRNTNRTLTDLLQELNPILRGWGYYYRFCTRAKETFSRLDGYVTDRPWRWMRKTYPKASVRWLLGHKGPRAGYRQLVWRADKLEQFLTSSLTVRRYQRGWMGMPDFAMALGEPDAQRKVHVRFGERAREPDGGNAARRPALLNCSGTTSGAGQSSLSSS